jgi:uroporphyrinogen decarboxylase
VPVIGFPRGAGGGYAAFAREAGVQAVALDTSVDPAWAKAALPVGVCLQGNLDPLLMVVGGEPLVAAARATVAAFAGRPHVFNLGHGITPEATPENVETLLRAIRSQG